jgi:hypothetical protein
MRQLEIWHPRKTRARVGTAHPGPGWTRGRQARTGAAHARPPLSASLSLSCVLSRTRHRCRSSTDISVSLCSFASLLHSGRKTTVAELFLIFYGSQIGSETKGTGGGGGGPPQGTTTTTTITTTTTTTTRGTYVVDDGDVLETWTSSCTATTTHNTQLRCRNSVVLIKKNERRCIKSEALRGDTQTDRKTDREGF